MLLLQRHFYHIYVGNFVMFPPSGGLSGILCFRLDLHACLGPWTCHVFFWSEALESKPLRWSEWRDCWWMERSLCSFCFGQHGIATFPNLRKNTFFVGRFFSILTIFVDKFYHFQTQFVAWTFPSCVWKAPGKHIGCLHCSSLSSDSIESFLICFVCLPLRREMIHPWKLTWFTRKWTKEEILFKTMFRFHV